MIDWADDGEGNDRFPDSFLDCTFIAHLPDDWTAESSVVVREGDFPDDETTSDHRPVGLKVSF